MIDVKSDNATHLLVSDLDGTLLGDDAALGRFAEWFANRPGDLLLAYASGRAYASVQKVIHGSGLPQPDAVISDVGTAIHVGTDGSELKDWQDRIATNWNADRVREMLADDPQLVAQPGDCQTDFKVSYYLHDASDQDIAALERRIQSAGVHGQVVYSSGRDLDVLPAGADKASAAALLAASWKVPQANVIAAGDSGNDRTLLTGGFRAIVVANAQPELSGLDGELIYRARRSFADGVVEGLEHWLHQAPNPGEADVGADRI